MYIISLPKESGQWEWGYPEECQGWKVASKDYTVDFKYKTVQITELCMSVREISKKRGN
jgi:hypothetical protein